MTTICHFPFWFQWKHLSRLPKVWNFHLVDSKCFQIKFITNNFFFTGRCHFQLSNIRIANRFWLAGDDDYLRGATSINHQVALSPNFKMYSRSAKGGEKGDPNRNPWLATMTFPEHPSSPPVFSGVCVTQSLVLCVCFVDHCLSYFAIVLSVLRFTDSYYPFCFLKLFLRLEAHMSL
jgi:hypothetical protein